MENSLYFHALNLLPGLGPSGMDKIRRNFTSPKEAYFSSFERLEQAGIEKSMALKIQEAHKTINLEKEKENLQNQGISLINFQEPSYPRLLLEISKFPPLLYCRGNLKGNELCISVVGTRKITNYGRSVIPFLLEPLLAAGIVMVSGLAFGVDAAVQKLAADRGKKTVSVLGGGLDEKSLYPKEHTYLADTILNSGGALISEYPPGTPPLKYNFIARNRIISGISCATIIVECGLKSGSLITANYALEQNRTVYAVPGPIYSEQSYGPNNLIKMGAKAATSAEDVLYDLNLTATTQGKTHKKVFGDSPAENAILETLGPQPLGIDQIIRQCGLPAGEVISSLTFLEMKGKIGNVGGQQYVSK